MRCPSPTGLLPFLGAGGRIQEELSMTNQTHASEGKRWGTTAHAASLFLALALLAPSRMEAAALQQVGVPAIMSEGERGFLFQRPRGTIAIRSGLLFHRAGSDVFTFAAERFTVERSDFRALSIGVEGTIWLGDHLEGTLTIDGSRVTRPSEARNWLEEDGSPIRQSTRLTVGPSVALGARYFLFERGESFGRLAWIPTRLNLFVGAGGGIAPYRFEQWGDFVNETTATIFTSDVESKGAVFTPYLSGGSTLRLTPRIALLIEGRYQWGETELKDQFSGFEPIDLAGLRTSLSLGYSF